MKWSYGVVVRHLFGFKGGLVVCDHAHSFVPNPRAVQLLVNSLIVGPPRVVLPFQTVEFDRLNIDIGPTRVNFLRGGGHAGVACPACWRWCRWIIAQTEVSGAADGSLALSESMLDGPLGRPSLMGGLLRSEGGGGGALRKRGGGGAILDGWALEEAGGGGALR